MSPIVGTFVADFASFTSAVAAAETKLVSFESGSNKVQSALQRMETSFSGTKIIQEAALTVEAINRIGGASKLTEAELARAGATATQAMAKMKALGMEVPPGLQKIVDTSQKMEPALSTGSKAAGLLSSAFGQFTAAGVAIQVIGAVTGKVTEFINTGLKLPAVEGAFDRLNASVHQNSSDMLAAMTTGTKGMVANYDLMVSANKAILLGLPVTSASMGDLAKTATILGKAMGQDATKSLDDLITALGRSSPMILDNLGLTVKVGEANEAYARKLHVAVGELTDADKKMAFYEAAMEAARKKTKELGDQTQTFGEIIGTVMTKAGNEVSTNVGTMNVGLGMALSSFKEFALFSTQAAAGGFSIALAAAAERAKDLARALPAVVPIAKDVAKALEVTGLTAAQSARLETELEKAITDRLKTEKEAATDRAAAIKEADAIALATFQSQITNLQAVEAARMKSYGTVEQLAMLGRLDQAEQALSRAVYGEIDSEKERMKIIEASGARHTAITQQKITLEAQLTQQIATSMLAELEAKNKVAAMYASASGAKAQVDILGDLDRAVAKLQATEVAGQPISERVAALTETATRALQAQAIAGQQAGAALADGNKAASDVPAAAAGAVGGFNAISGAAQQAGNSLLGMSAELFNAIRAAQLMDEQTNRFGHVVAPTPIPGMSASRRALGGPVSSGTPYLVGEQGPELFVPGTSGSIVANGASGGSGGVTVHVTVQGTVIAGAELARVVSAQIQRSLSQGQKMRGH